MDYGSLNIFQLMKTKMAYLSERQDVLAGNIANIDTPGARAKDLKKLDFSRLALIEAKRLRIRATSPNHITEPARKKGDFRVETSRKTFETTPVKNSIVLEEQMAKIAHNQLEYQTVTNLYSKVTSMFKTAIGNN